MTFWCMTFALEGHPDNHNLFISLDAIVAVSEREMNHLTSYGTTRNNLPV